MKNIIIHFWNGKISLWKSYWIIGELLNALVFLLLYNIEARIFENKLVYDQFPLIFINNFSFISKIFLFIWTIFITVGIWRSAENYKGRIIWIILTMILLSYRIFALRSLILN